MKHLLIFVFAITTAALHAQYTSNPLKDKKWINVSAGLTNMDNVSWMGSASASLRTDVLITSGRIAYSQELFEADNDSVLSPKNRLIEMGLMWGEGYAGKNWYVSLVGGMGLNLRLYADDDDNTPEIRRLTAVTIGVPVQLEAGVFFTEQIGLSINGVANWNFRRPYVGAHIGCFYRFKK